LKRSVVVCRAKKMAVVAASVSPYIVHIGTDSTLDYTTIGSKSTSDMSLFEYEKQNGKNANSNELPYGSTRGRHETRDTVQ
jgi:hypothetical protein